MRRSGFTLIELMIVVVIIGILVGIAVPRYQNSKSRAHVSAMKSDLRNLSAAQTAYFAAAQSYSSDTVALNYHTSMNSTLTFAEASNVGWGASLTTIGAPGVTCALFEGTVGSAPTPATEAGLIKCNDVP